MVLRSLVAGMSALLDAAAAAANAAAPPSLPPQAGYGVNGGGDALTVDPVVAAAAPLLVQVRRLRALTLTLTLTPTRSLGPTLT